MVNTYKRSKYNTGGFEYVEDTIRGRIAGWMNEIISREKLNFDYVDEQIEVIYPDGKKRKFPDITIWEQKLKVAACLIEFKPPIGWTPYDMTLIEDAQEKAINVSPQVRYFGTWNTNEMVLWQTFDPDAKSIIDRRKARYEVVKVKSLKELDRPEVEKKIKEFLVKFLKDLEDIYYERKVIPKLTVDEFFIYNLRAIVESFEFPISEYIKRDYKKKSKFKNNLNEWFVEQGWTPPTTDEDFERTARQFLYLLLDKIMFYNTLRIKYSKLKAIKIKKAIETGDELKEELQGFFASAEKITGDYETIFGVNFIETIPIPDIVVSSFRYFINGFSKHDFSKLGFKDIGRIFDRLIPINERHKLGQYFTRSDVVDLINGFCIKRGSDKVADFGCGAGTFLVRSYARMMTLDSYKDHKELLEQIWGVDISKFPAHLSAINLAVRDLSEVENYPRVICKDFFEVYPTEDQEKLRYWLNLTERLETLSKGKKKVYVPFMDAVVGNPPYTRQEELEDYIPGYKAKLEEALKDDWGKEVKVGKRASIHAYFFLHGLKFLKGNGKFGYITSNSWLDVDYGKYLQEFFLKRFKIIAIIESKIERWFEEADVNTAITILERCYTNKKSSENQKEDERKDNLIKFVQIKCPLREIIPSTDDEKERWETIENFIQFIENTDELYDDNKMRIFPKKQRELWEEGYDEEKGRYVGSKWSKYIRAPDIFFDILRKGEDLFVPIKGNIAKVTRGFTTGANEFFYLTEEEIKSWGIERKFWMHREGRKWVPNYLIKSPKECTTMLVKKKDLKLRVLSIKDDKKDLRGKNILKYIRWGEEQGFHNRPTCKSRKRWYELPELPRADVLFRQFFDKTFNFPLKRDDTPTDHTFYYLCLNNKSYSNVIAAIINSTLYTMFVELYGRTVMGQGVLIAYGPEIRPIPMINPSKLSKSEIKKLKEAFKNISKRPVGTVFEEIGASKPKDASLKKVKPDKRKLDKIVMGKILGLTENEQLEVYQAVVDLVKSRMERAQSVDRKKKSRGPDVNVLAEGVISEIDISGLGRFPDDYITGEVGTLTIPSGTPEVVSDLSGIYVKIDGERINCEFPERAEYIKFSSMNGKTTIKIPKTKSRIKKAVSEYKKVYKKIKKEINEYIKKFIPDKKLRDKVETLVWKKILIGNEQTVMPNNQ